MDCSARENSSCHRDRLDRFSLLVMVNLGIIYSAILIQSYYVVNGLHRVERVKSNLSNKLMKCLGA